jgi:ParB family chromosome partitioning protein
MGTSPEKPARAKGPRAGSRVSPALSELATRLSDRFETRVKVDLGKSKGKITVEFASMEDLERILTTLAPDETPVLQTLSASEVEGEAQGEPAEAAAE